jgi:hypothetical protein
MLNIFGNANRFCDGLSRRSFLQVGALGVGGLTLPNLLRADATAGRRSSHKSVIMVYLSGGMSHHETFDLKPNAPAEIRGEFNPISTNVPGTQVGEYLPRISRVMDKLVVLRSLVGFADEHSSFQTSTGFGMDRTRRENRPHFGSVTARMLGRTDPVMPAFVDLFPTMQHRPYNSPGPALLGAAASGVRVDGEDIAVMRPRGVTIDQLQDRRSLVSQLDGGFGRNADGTTRRGVDTFHEMAYEVLTSNKMTEAVDITKEPDSVRNRYGRGSSTHLGDGAPLWNDQLLMARRLVEAGARVVTVAYGFWDTHGGNFSHMRRHLPTFDAGISALIEDIYQRGLDQDVTVCVWGEFGRTPKINKDAGRDHWAPVNFALLSGGGMKTGQVIGATDSIGGQVRTDAIHYHDVLATIYENLGVDPHGMVYDIANRPNPILPSTANVIRRIF